MMRVRARLPYVRPLTRRTKKGARYARPDDIEAQIAKAVLLPSSTLLQRARSDVSHRPRLREETIVYLIREYHRTRQHRPIQRRLRRRRLVDDLAGILRARCMRDAGHLVESVPHTFRAHMVEDAIGDLFVEIFDVRTDRSDILQVAFWLGFKSLRVAAYSRLLDRRKGSQHHVSLVPPDALSPSRGTDAPPSSPWASLRDDSPAADVEQRVLDRWVRRAVEGEGTPQRLTFLMRYDDGMSVQQIAARLGVSKSTVCQRIVAAAEELRVEIDRGQLR